MPNTTPRGFPYALPSDARVDWPATSQSVANSLETFADALNVGTQSVWTPATGWAAFGGAYPGLYLTRNGPTVTIEGMAKRTSDIILANGTSVPLGTLPVGFRPTQSVLVASILALSGLTNMSVCRLELKADGSLNVVPTVAGTLGANIGWVTVAATFRGA